MVDIVVFDLDGTLIDSMPAHAKAFAAALVGHDADSDRTQHNRIVQIYLDTAGAPLVDQFMDASGSVAEPEEIDRLVSDFWTYVDAVTYSPFADAMPCLEGLTELGVPVTVSSGGSQRSVDRKLRDSALTTHVVVALGSDNAEAGAKGIEHLSYIWNRIFPNRPLNLARILFVGDTSHDMTMARDLGSIAVAISRDERLLPDPEEVAHVVLASLIDLPAMLGPA